MLYNSNENLKNYECVKSSRIGVIDMINTREIAEEYRLTHWAGIMRERAESGLTIKAYCKQIGICGNTYFYWQRRVRAAAHERLSLPEQRAVTPSESLIPVFAEVRMLSPTMETVPSELPMNEVGPKQECIRIEFNGVRIHFDATYPPERLASFVREIGRV